VSLDELATRPAPAGAKILLLDLERLSGKATIRIWHPRDLKYVSYLPPEKWDRLPSTLCGSWQWLTDKRVGFVAAWENPDDPYHVANVFRGLLDEATHVVTYNGNRADLLWLSGDRAQGGIPEPSPYKSVDLFKMQAKYAFERRSLRHLLDRLDLPNKSGHYDPDEADAAMDGDEKARRSLIKYNKQDTRALVELYLRVRPRLGLNLGAFYADAEDVVRCPHCAGVDTLKADGWYGASVQTYGQLRCDVCGGYARNNIVKSRSRVRGIS